MIVSLEKDCLGCEIYPVDRPNSKKVTSHLAWIIEAGKMGLWKTRALVIASACCVTEFRVAFFVQENTRF